MKNEEQQIATLREIAENVAAGEKLSKESVFDLMRMAYRLGEQSGEAATERAVCAWLRSPDNNGKSHTHDLAAELERMPSVRQWRSSQE